MNGVELDMTRHSISPALGMLLLCGCAATTPPVTAPRTTGTGPLANVVLLPLTTRELDGLLGHSLGEDGVTPDRSSKLFRLTPRLSETSQHVTVVREASTDAMVSAGYGPAAGEFSTGELTHLGYVVEITGYAEIAPRADYLPGSDCCFNGHVQPACAGGYVERVVRGSGVIKFLKRAGDQVGLKVAEIFETRTGQRYRVLDEYRFEDAYFGFERGDVARLCRTLPDEATFEPTAVTPTPNCSVVSYDLRGSSKHLSRFLPDMETCRTVGARFCHDTADCVRCVGAFQNGEQDLKFTLAIEPSAGVLKARQIPDTASPSIPVGAAAGTDSPQPASVPRTADDTPEPGAPAERQQPSTSQ